VKRISKPGLRKYSTSKAIPRSLGGYGLTIVSTSQGVMSDKDAKKKGVGGELLCSIW
jgi:small subunit ribosomal protein S8